MGRLPLPRRAHRDEAHARRHAAVRERDPELRGDAHGGGDARHHVHRDAALAQILKLLPAPPKDEGVAALEADDAGAGAGELLRFRRRALRGAGEGRSAGAAGGAGRGERRKPPPASGAGARKKGCSRSTRWPAVNRRPIALLIALNTKYSREGARLRSRRRSRASPPGMHTCPEARLVTQTTERI